MQLVQDGLYQLCVKVVTDSRFTDASVKHLRDEFQKVFGENMSIEIQYVSGLEQTQAGKYRFAICNV
jgi:phenylacetate-coenzyme A ligase PaaK-like adenylate-forming protein